MNTITDQIAALFDKYDAKARELWPSYARRPKPELLFYVKGRTAGLADPNMWAVKINTHVAAQNMEAAENTVSHEVAHMVDFACRGKSNHDRHWRAIHRILGGNGERCSNYGNITVQPGRNTNWYLYRNPDGIEVWVGPKHHASMVKKSGYRLRDRHGNRFNASDFTGESRKKHSP